MPDHALPLSLGYLRRIRKPGAALVPPLRRGSLVCPAAQRGFSRSRGRSGVSGALPAGLSGKGTGSAPYGRNWALLALGALGKSVLGYQYADGVLTFFPSWGMKSWLFLAAACLGLAAAVVLRRLPPGKAYPKAAWSLVLCYVILALAVLVMLYRYDGASHNPARTVSIAARQPAVHPGLQPHRHLAGSPAHGRGTAPFGRRTGYLPVSFQPNFYARAALRSDPADQRRRRALRISEPVGQYRAAQHAPVRGAAGLGPATGCQTPAARNAAFVSARFGLRHTRSIRYQPKLGQPPVLSVFRGTGLRQPAASCKNPAPMIHVPRSGRIGLTGVIL